MPAETVLLEKPVPPDTWEENPSQEKWEKYENDFKKWEEDMKNCTRGESFCFCFYNKDHIGNNREVVDTGGNVSQVTSYYPYGMPFCDSEAGKGAGVQPYKYNGKELDLMHGLNTYDYGARQYFSALPVWDRMDKMCESAPGMSPYCYCKGDPVNSHDPDGNDPVTGAVIGAGIEIGSQLIENYDTKQSFFSNLANNVNWVNVGIAAEEGALTSGVSALKSVAAKTVVTAVTSTAKEISSQVKDGATSYKDIDYVKVAGNAGISSLISFSSGKLAHVITKKEFKNVKARPTNRATMHYRAGQKRYSRSTMRNARKRLQHKIENYYNKWENRSLVVLNAAASYIKRLLK